MSSRAGLQDLRLLCHLLRLPHQRASFLRRDFPFESSEPFPALSVWLAVMTQAFLIFPPGFSFQVPSDLTSSCRSAS